MSAKTTRRKKPAVHKRDHPFKIFRLPPEGFDARKASARELLLHGVPKRPNAETHPKLQLLWDQIAQRRPRFIEPAFLPAEKFHRSKLRDHRSLFDITSFFFQAEDGIRDLYVTGVQTCALPI